MPLKKNATLGICGVLLYLHISPKMDLYTYECMHRIYSFGQPCLILLTNCMKVTYNNYNKKSLINIF